VGPVGLVGLAITALVAAIEGASALGSVEGWLLDRRMLWGQGSAPDPSEDIVHVDIDDEALEEVGRWPWDRELLAMAIDALADAGARVIVLDLLLDDAQRPRWRPDGAGGFELVRDDDILAASIDRAGNVVMGVHLDKPKPKDAGERTRKVDVDMLQWIVVPPVGVIAGVADALGFVNTQSEDDQRIRRIPPKVEAQGEDWWQLGVMGAARQLGVDPGSLSSTDRELRVGGATLELTDRRMLVPWRTRPVE